jgi:hypothetical protein
VEILQNIDPGNAAIIGLACACLCGLGFILVTGLHVVTSVLGVLGGLFEIVFEILGGGPVAWCGCLVGVAACAGLIGLAILLVQAFSTCGTAQAINLCSLLGQ